MKNKKGFTLIELLTVIVIIGILGTIAIMAVNSYLKTSKDKSYKIAEKSFTSATLSALSDCSVNGEGSAFCTKHQVPATKYTCDIVYLKELIDNEYIDSIKNPYNTNEQCSVSSSYVYVSNKANTEKENNNNLVTKVCLVCGDKKSLTCTEIKTGDCTNSGGTEDNNYNAFCSITYADTGEIYDGVWTNRNLNLNFTASGDFRYGIDEYKYKIGTGSLLQVDATNNQATVLFDQTVNNQAVKVTAYDGMQKTASANCPSTIKLDKEKIIGGTLTGTLTDGKPVNSGSWASTDVKLTATANPTTVPSGYVYQWYKDGVKIGSETTSSTYTATENGTYKVVISNSIHTETITTNEFVVKIDKFKPTVVIKNNPLTLGTQDYTFTDNITTTFGESGGTVTCDPATSKKTGSYTVTCTAKGNNGLETVISFSAKHSYSPTVTKENYSCNCYDTRGCCGSQYHYTCCYCETMQGQPAHSGCTTHCDVMCDFKQCATCQRDVYNCPSGGSYSSSSRLCEY